MNTPAPFIAPALYFCEKMEPGPGSYARSLNMPESGLR